jgi:cellulose biosynthesis protein BcsQ
MLRKTSLGNVLLVVGGILTIVGFVAYFQENATLNLAGFFYGIPVLLGGLALRAAELEPTQYSQETTPDVLALREQQATPTQNQVRSDVTRYRYGQEAHLDEVLERLGLSPTDEQRPELVAVREASIDGAYALVLEFDSPFIALSTWLEKQDKIEKFFGPNIRAEMTEPQEKKVELALITVATPEPVETVS